MTPETFDHIREDVRNAMVENRQDDPGLMPELVMYLLGVLYEAAGGCLCDHNPDGDGYPRRECPDHGEPAWAAAAALERCQLRAVSQIPFAEGDACAQDYDPDWSDHR